MVHQQAYFVGFWVSKAHVEDKSHFSGTIKGEFVKIRPHYQKYGEVLS